MKRKRSLRWLAGALTVMMILSLTPMTAMAYINRGNVDINGKDTYSLDSGSKAYLTVRPYKEDHLPGCQMDICPTECGAGCIIYIDGQMECTCGGLDMVTYYAQVEVSSSDTSVAEAVYNDRGTVVVTAKSKGVATIRITAAFREYTTTNKTVKVLVDGAEDPSGSGDDPSDPGDNPSDPGDNSSDPGDNPSDPGDNSSDPGDNPSDPGDNPSDPGDDPSDPGDNPSDPGDNPSDPGDNPSDPGDDPSDPGDNPSDPGEQTGPYSGVIYKDVNGWEKVYVYYLTELGILNGKAEGIFAPQDNVTRAEFAKILAAASGNKMPEVTEQPFSDVPADAWYAPYVSWAKVHGIVNGVGDNQFSPQSEISRQDIAVMISRYAEKQRIELPENEAVKEFTDAAEISGYAAEAVQQMQKAGIISGYPDGSFGSKKSATRAETAKMVAVFLQNTHIC